MSNSRKKHTTLQGEVSVDCATYQIFKYSVHARWCIAIMRTNDHPEWAMLLDQWLFDQNVLLR
jgi:hypothetical protein